MSSSAMEPLESTENMLDSKNNNSKAEAFNKCGQSNTRTRKSKAERVDVAINLPTEYSLAPPSAGFFVGIDLIVQIFGLED